MHRQVSKRRIMVHINSRVDILVCRERLEVSFFGRLCSAGSESWLDHCSKWEFVVSCQKKPGNSGWIWLMHTRNTTSLSSSGIHTVLFAKPFSPRSIHMQ